MYSSYKLKKNVEYFSSDVFWYYNKQWKVNSMINKKYFINYL